MYQKPSYKSQTINETSIIRSRNLSSDHQYYGMDNRHNRSTMSPRLSPRFLGAENAANHSHNSATQSYTMSSTTNARPVVKSAPRMGGNSQISVGRQYTQSPVAVAHVVQDPDLSWTTATHHITVSSSNRPRVSSNSPSVGSSTHNMFPSALSAAVDDRRDQFSIFGSFNRTRSERRDRSERYESMRPPELPSTTAGDLVASESPWQPEQRSVSVEPAWQPLRTDPSLTTSDYFTPNTGRSGAPRTLLDLINRDETDNPRPDQFHDRQEQPLERQTVVPVSSGAPRGRQSPDSSGERPEAPGGVELRRLAKTVDKLNAKLKSSQAANEELQTHLRNLLGERKTLIRQIETTEFEEVIEEEEVQRAPAHPTRDGREPQSPTKSEPSTSRDPIIGQDRLKVASIGDLPARIVNAYRTEIIDHERAKMEIEKRTLLETLKIQHQHQLQAVTEQLESARRNTELQLKRDVAAKVTRFRPIGSEVDMSGIRRGSFRSIVTSVQPVLVSKATQNETRLENTVQTLAKQTHKSLMTRTNRTRTTTNPWQAAALERIMGALESNDPESMSAALEEILFRPAMIDKATEVDKIEAANQILAREAHSSFRNHIKRSQITTTKSQESLLNRLITALQTSDSDTFWSLINQLVFKSVRTVAVECAPLTYNKNLQTTLVEFHDKACDVNLTREKPPVDKSSKSVSARPTVLHKGCQPEELFCFETGTLTDHIFYRSQGVNTLGDPNRSFQSPFPDADAFVTLKSNRSETIRQVKSQFSNLRSSPINTEIHTEKTEIKQGFSKFNDFPEELEKPIRVQNETPNMTSPKPESQIPIEVKSGHFFPTSEESDRIVEIRNEKATKQTKESSENSTIYSEKVEKKHTSSFQTSLKHLPDEWEKIIKERNAKESNDNNDSEIPMNPTKVSETRSNTVCKESDKIEDSQKRIVTKETDESSVSSRNECEKIEEKHTTSLKHLPDEWEKIIKDSNEKESYGNKMKDSTDNAHIHVEKTEVKHSNKLPGEKTSDVKETREQISIRNISDFNHHLEQLNQDIMKADFTRDSEKDFGSHSEKIVVKQVTTTVSNKEFRGPSQDWETMFSANLAKRHNENETDTTYDTVIRRPHAGNTEIPIEIKDMSTSPRATESEKKTDDGENMKDSKSRKESLKFEDQFFKTVPQNHGETNMKPRENFETWEQSIDKSVKVVTTNVEDGSKPKEEVPTTVECWETISKIKDGEVIENKECYRDRYVSSNPDEILKHIEAHQQDHLHGDYSGHENLLRSAQRLISESDSASVLDRFNFHLDSDDRTNITEDTLRNLKSFVKEIPVNTRIVESSKTVRSSTSVPISSRIVESSKTVSSTTSVPSSPRIERSSKVVTSTISDLTNSRISESSRTLSDITSSPLNPGLSESSKTIPHSQTIPINSRIIESSKTVSSTTSMPSSPRVEKSSKIESSMTSDHSTSRTLSSTSSSSINPGLTESSKTISHSKTVPISSRTIESSKTSTTSVPISPRVEESSKIVSSTTSMPSGSTESNRKVSHSTSIPVNSKVVESSKTSTITSTTSASINSRKSESSKTVSNTTSVPTNSRTLESSKTQSSIPNEPTNSKVTESSKIVSHSTTIPITSRTIESFKTVSGTTSEPVISRLVESHSATVPIGSKTSESSKTVSSLASSSINSRKSESSKTVSSRVIEPVGSRISESSKTVFNAKSSPIVSRKSESSKIVTQSSTVPSSSRKIESSKTVSSTTSVPVGSRISESTKTVSNSTTIPINSRVTESSKTVSSTTSASASSRRSESSKTVSGTTSIPVNSRTSESSKTVTSTSSTIPVVKHTDETGSFRNPNVSQVPENMSVKSTKHGLSQHLMESDDSHGYEGVTISERTVLSSISKTISRSGSANALNSPVSMVSDSMPPNNSSEKEARITGENSSFGSVSNQGEVHSNSSAAKMKPQILPKPIRNQSSEPFRLTPEIETMKSGSTAIGSQKSAFYSLSDSSKTFQSLDNEHFEVLLPEDIFQFSSQVLLWLNGNKHDSSANIEHFPADLIQTSSILVDWWVDTVVRLSASQLMATIKYLTSTFSKNLVKFLMTNRDQQGNTCLHYVIGQQFWQTFSTLYSTGLVNPDLYNSQGYTVMMVASIIEVTQESLSTYIKMLAMSANLNLRSKQQGETALFLAALNDNDNTIRLLVSLGADINLADNDGNTPLMIAVMNNKIKAVQMILNVPTVLTEIRNKEDNTALAIAERNRFGDIVNLFRAHTGHHHSEVSSFSRVSQSKTFVSSPVLPRKLN